MSERTIQRVEDLEVFRRAYRLSLEVHRASLELPRIEQFALADQLRRSSKSICANLAEGFARQSHSAAEYRRYLTVAIGCTGGHHRSVYLVERLARAFSPRYQVLIRHRELG